MFKAWRVTAMKCNAFQLFDVIMEFALLCKTASSSIAGYFGAGGDGGNFMTNDLMLAEPIQHVFNAAALMENVAICACARFEFVFNIAFIPFNNRHLVLAIDNNIQIFVRVFQSVCSDFSSVSCPTFTLSISSSSGRCSNTGSLLMVWSWKRWKRYYYS